MEQVRDAMIQARDWLDGMGMGAWIAAMVLGFIVFFPIGLGILAYLLWSGRMGCRGGRRGWRRSRSYRGGETGNAAFDAYREETLTRLEEERKAFTDFMEQLRRAKDQAEFDQFMRERAQGGSAGAPSAGDAQQGGDAARGAGSGAGWGGAPQTA